MKTVGIEVTIRPETLMQIVRRYLADENFRHEEWSLWQAECLERLARKIRTGYEAEETNNAT